MIKKNKSLMITLCMSFLMLTACGEEATLEENAPISESVIENKTTEKETEPEIKFSEKDLIPNENVYYWASTLKTGTPKELTQLNSALNTLPLTEECLNTVGDFEEDRMFREDEYFTFSEMLDAPLETDLKGNPFLWRDDECEAVREEPPMIVYYTHNINEDDQTIKRDMFEQGYWYIRTKLDNQSSYKFWNEETSKWELFDYYIEVLGEPSYIRVPEAEAESVKEEGAAYYERMLSDEYKEHNSMPEEEKYGFIVASNVITLVWEHEDYVLQTYISEMFVIRDSISQVDGYDVVVEYYPKQQWESYWKDEQYKSYKLVDVVLTDE